MNPSLCDLQTKRNNDDDDDNGGPVDIPCSSEKKSESVTTINDLTDHLLSKIIVRLDAKSAHRCKSVSKTWFSEISTPDFVRSYISHWSALVRRDDFSSLWLPFIPVPGEFRSNETLENNGVMDYFSDDAFGPRGFVLDFLPCFKRERKEDPRVIGPSNDLLRCDTRIKVIGASTDLLLCAENYHFYVCNPFTKQWVQLPPRPRPSREEVFSGFASLPVTENSNGQYRVVIGSPSKKSGRIHLEVFSSETSEWKGWELDCSRFEYPLPNLGTRSWNPHVSLCEGGRLLWMTSFEFESKACQFFAYNPFANNYAVIPVPEEVEVDEVFVGVFRGRLRLLNMLIDGEDTTVCIIRVWEMEDDKFFKVYDVNIETSNRSFLSAAFSKLGRRFISVKRERRMSITFHPVKGEKVYMWVRGYLAKCNLCKGKFQIKEWKGFGERHSPGSLHFSLVKPWFPTPVGALTPT